MNLPSMHVVLAWRRRSGAPGRRSVTTGGKPERKKATEGGGGGGGEGMRDPESICFEPLGRVFWLLMLAIILLLLLLLAIKKRISANWLFIFQTSLPRLFHSILCSSYLNNELLAFLLLLFFLLLLSFSLEYAKPILLCGFLCQKLELNYLCNPLFDELRYQTGFQHAVAKF